MTLFLGIDIGTYESKGVLVDGEGTIVARAARPHKMLVPQPGWAEHRAEEDWWGDFVHLCKELIADSGADPATIAAVGCSAIGPCMLPVDGDGTPLCNAVLYGVDSRASTEVDELTTAIGVDRLMDRCGNELTSQSVGPKILWLKRHRRDIYDRARYFLTSTSYLVFKLTGQAVIDHYTAANFSPLYDIDSAGWSADLAAGIVEPERLARIAWTGEIAGQVTDEAARETGLAAGTPVITGTVDAAAEAVSVGVLAPGDMMMMYGSSVFVIQLTAERVRDPRLWYAPWLFANQHACMSTLATGGTLTHWFRSQLARDLAPETAFPDLAREAESSPPGANGLMMTPYFAGMRTPVADPSAKGTLLGLDLTHTRGDISRAVLEGIAYATNHIFETYAAVGHPPKRVLSVGGGTKNAVWAQATSDISGKDQILKRQTIGASYGDAFLAAVAVGAAQLSDIERWNPAARTITARPNEIYERNYAVFRDVYGTTKDLIARLA